MVKFRPHDSALSRAEAEKHRQAASAKYPTHSDEWFAELQILKLQDIAAKGLWSCYLSFEHYLADFYADFAWDGRQARQIELLLADARLPLVVALIRVAHDFDLEAELRQALQSGEAPKREGYQE
jgi:hypothetical protein